MFRFIRSLVYNGSFLFCATSFPSNYQNAFPSKELIQFSQLNNLNSKMCIWKQFLET